MFAVSACLWLLFLTALPPAAGEDPDVIVVGAGVSGLAAALQLQRLGLSVQVLEAKDHVGGRAWSQALVETTNRSVDMGAQWLEGYSKHPLKPLLSRLGFSPEPDAGEDMIVDDEGHGVGMWTAKERDALYRDFNEVYRRVSWHQSNTYEDSPLLDLVLASWREVRAKLKGPLRANTPRAMALLRFVWKYQIENDYLGSLEELSGLFFDDDEDVPGGEAMFCRQSIGRVVREGFAPLLGPDTIRLNTPVVKIDTSSSPATTVSVKTKAGATLKAKAVVFTGSIGVLKANMVQFVPPLRPALQSAIDRDGLGLDGKVILEFPRRWYSKSLSDLVSISPNSYFEYTFPTYFGDKPVWFCFLSGTEANNKFASYTDEQLVAVAMNEIRTLLFPRTEVPDPINWRVHRWAKDPYTRCAYAFAAVGFTKSDFDEFQNTGSSRLVLAGEHTSKDYSGTLNGAIASGVAAAQKLAQGVFPDRACGGVVGKKACGLVKRACRWNARTRKCGWAPFGV